MTDYARKLLDELMPNRNQDKKTITRYFDAEVCKHFLVDFCPHLQFYNTKADLGPCVKIHEDKLKEEYERECLAQADRDPEKRKQRDQYTERYYEYLDQLVRDLDRKIRRGKERLQIRGDEKFEDRLYGESKEKAIALEEKIKAVQAEIERCGEEGLIEEAQVLMREVDGLHQELASVRDEMSKNEKKMEVCDTCGAFLVLNDAPERLMAHMEGKQHNGYLKIRQNLHEWKASRGSRRPSEVSGSVHDRRDGGSSHGHDDTRHSSRRGSYDDRHPHDYRDSRYQDQRDDRYNDRRRGDRDRDRDRRRSRSPGRRRR